MKNWICLDRYANISPINEIFHKQHVETDIPDLDVKSLYFFARKEFSLDEVKSSFLHLTADDYYTLYVNGQFVTVGPAPCYPQHQNINVIDVSDYLTVGKNVIAVHCLYSGYINRVYTSADGRIGLWAKLYSGDEPVLETDESWKLAIDESFTPGKMVGYKTQMTENRDMNLYPHGWNEVGFDDSGWENAVIKTDDDHIPEYQMTPNVACDFVHAQTIVEFGEGNFLLDFGAELVGCLLVDVCGKKGSTVRLLCGEELLDDGHVRYEMRCGCTYNEAYVLSGKHDRIMNFEYKGFRYVEVLVGDSGVLPENISVMKRHYPVTSPVFFHSSDDGLENIWNICKNSVVLGSQEGFLDCPTREKGQYLGDLVITALSHVYLTGDARLYKKALLDFAKSSFICKGLMAVTPGSLMQEIADYSLLYPQFLKKYYDLTGDMDLLRKLSSVAEDCVDHFGKFMNENGLLAEVTDKWNLVDWPKNLRDDYDFELTLPIGEGCHNVINAYYYGAILSMNEIFEIIGREKKYDTEAFRDAYIRAFFREKTGLFADSVTSDHCNFHSNVLPLCFGIVDAKLADSISRFIMDRGLCCGVYFSYFVFLGLARYRKYKEIYALITDEGIHSWKNMLREGATSSFEAWGKDQKWNTSLCHPWSSSPIIMITEVLLGYRFEGGVLKRDDVRLPDGVTAELRGGFTDTKTFIQ